MASLQSMSRLAQLARHARRLTAGADTNLAQAGCCHQAILAPVRHFSSSAPDASTNTANSGSPRHDAEAAGTGTIGNMPKGNYEYDDSNNQYDSEYGEEQDSQHDRDRALRRILRSSNAAELAAVHFFRGLSCNLSGALLRDRCGPLAAAAGDPGSGSKAGCCPPFGTSTSTTASTSSSGCGTAGAAAGAPGGGRPDVQWFADQEQQAAEAVRQLLPRYRVRPSLAQGPLSLACMALGAAAAAAPPRLGLAVVGAVGGALEEHYNEQLRRLNEAGAAEQAPDVRQTLRTLRDTPRIPEGAPPAPDLISVLQEGLAATAAGARGGAAGGAGQGPSVLSGVAGAVREWGVEGTVGAVVKAGARVALEAAERL
ncbi:hypothetical protein Agub_g919 [Astrephomene gubernaculifera]|uniref:Ubiquinone biosynthesis protein n=1 Tax=Astrephomene gubernaculifera TaxID=47775 RepID=A0AAD3HH39_9CHLO|nr:hypothetical protein Agub_g919 [Astrephomene gubernaculifera]